MPNKKSIFVLSGTVTNRQVAHNLDVMKCIVAEDTCP